MMLINNFVHLVSMLIDEPYVKKHPPDEGNTDRRWIKHCVPADVVRSFNIDGFELKWLHVTFANSGGS